MTRRFYRNQLWIIGRAWADVFVFVRNAYAYLGRVDGVHTC